MIENKRELYLNKRKIGYEKEQIAKKFLEKNGYEVVEQNFFHRKGEIDIIAKNEGYLVFVEVKYRKSLKRGLPEEAITWKKMQSIYHAAQYYMLKHGFLEETPCRFDVVVILGEEIKLIKDAFEVC